MSAPTPRGVFLSYRRDDSSGYAGRLQESLAHHFGAQSVFMDVDSIEPGADFVDAINETLEACSVVLALMGPRWLGAASSDGARRLDDPTDLVRLELETALNQQVRVIPVLVAGACMPNETELPGSLARLCRRQALELSDRLWMESLARLISSLEESLGQPFGGSRPGPGVVPRRPVTAISVPIPSRVAVASAGTFVGRAAERAGLLVALKAAAAGRRQLVLVTGEPALLRWTQMGHHVGSPPDSPGRQMHHQGLFHAGQIAHPASRRSPERSRAAVMQQCRDKSSDTLAHPTRRNSAGAGVRAIAHELGRAPSTISRELRRNAATRGGKLDYRASVAH